MYDPTFAAIYKFNLKLKSLIPEVNITINMKPIVIGKNKSFVELIPNIKDKFLINFIFHKISGSDNKVKKGIVEARVKASHEPLIKLTSKSKNNFLLSE